MGHIMSSELTCVYAYDFLLTFYGNDIGQSRTVYEINDDFNRKSQIFLTSVNFAPKLIYGVPLGIQSKSLICESLKWNKENEIKEEQKYV